MRWIGGTIGGAPRPSTYFIETVVTRRPGDVERLQSRYRFEPAPPPPVAEPLRDAVDGDAGWSRSAEPDAGVGPEGWVSRVSVQLDRGTIHLRPEGNEAGSDRRFPQRDEVIDQGDVVSTTAAPHVFAIPGDVTRLAADSWLLPTDRTLHVTDGWYAAVPGLRAAIAALGPQADDFRAERVRALVLPRWHPAVPQPVLVPVPFEGIRDAEQVVEPLTAALQAAADAARDRAERRPASQRRGFPLVALPAFGSAGGGGDRLRGAILRRILDVAGIVGRETGIDVALVLRSPADLALAHSFRRAESGTWAVLGDDLVRRAQRLADEARTGQLVPFIGAGVSASAGLPTWGGLLEKLLAESDLPADEHDGFRRLGALDQAHVLRHRFEQRNRAFNETVARHTDADRYGLAPAILSGLPTREAVTLNYDTLYEKASADAGRPPAILPQEAVRPGERWLLKLHGTVTHPETIVLTREDYLGYGRARQALSAIAKAMLLTRHLLFVGFGLADDHFHELMHDVRQVLPRSVRGEARLGSALLLAADPLTTRLWGDDLDLIAMNGPDIAARGRLLEIFLDCLLAHADQGLGFFLDDRYRHRLSPAEQRLRQRLLDLAGAEADERDSPAWAQVQALLRSLGHRE